jgi:radical SAM family uncharacterized protein
MGVTRHTSEPISLDALDAILPAVEQPARYTGGEWNSVRKQWDSACLHFALAFPELYEVGMSNLGMTILYDLLNARPDILAERAYAPAPDMEKAMRAAGIPLYTLESRRPVRSFDIIGFSLAYELNYTNVLNMLDLAGLVVWARERGDDDPLIVGGGSMTCNPEPRADFFDLFVIGEGEEAALELADLYCRLRRNESFSKQEFLRQAARLDGVYVPSFYAVRYHADGTVAAVEPQLDGVPRLIRRRMVTTLPPPPVRPVVPYVSVIHDRANLEIQRGCGHGCRFCHAGMVYRPVRRRSREQIVDAVDHILRHTGHEEVALLSLSSTDYEGIDSLLAELLERHKEQAVSFSLPSLRIDSFSVRLASLTQERRKTGLTFAPEAGSQRLRDVINKGVTETDLLRTVEAAFGAGWRRVKLYFMLGLPSETEADIEAIVDLTYKVRDVGARVTGRRVEVSVSVATFVPKPFTPFQWTGLLDREGIVRRQELLKTRLRGKGLTVGWHDPDSSLLEAVLARGDRRVAEAVYCAWRRGARFDAWGDQFKPEAWWAAFDEAGLSPDFYARRQRALDEVLPWDHINVGVSKRFLAREWEKSQRGETTPGCVEECVGCGIRTTYGDALEYGEAICREGRD